MSTAATRTAYHHGDARNALIRTAAELLETAGAAGLSLRRVAERAGLSRQAPYNHFADKETLLAELVRDGFERLGQDTAAAGRSDGEPTARLQRAGEGYIAFAQGSPALFRLMFSKELVDLQRYPAAQATAAASLAHLAAIIGAMAPPDAVADLTLVAWSMVHGYATLCLEACLEGSECREGRAALFAGVIALSAARQRLAARGGSRADAS